MRGERPTSRVNLRAILLTGLVSLAVGVGSGLLINYLTEKRARLTYDITTQEVFSGELNNIGIFALRIANDGKREIEDLLCHLAFSDGEITERRITGIPESSRTVGGSGKELEVKVPFLNPGEQFSVQTLLGKVKQPLARPSIKVRGRGIVGTEAQPEKRARSSIGEVFSVVIAALAALLTALTTLLTRRTMRRSLTLRSLTERMQEDAANPTYHSADQRDAVAFALETKGLDDDARTIREWPRKLTYWAASDALCSKWRGGGDPEQIQKGIETLEFLINYAAVGDGSRRIIALNMAKLALIIKKHELVKKYLTAAREKEDAIIEKRIGADPALGLMAAEKDV